MTGVVVKSIQSLSMLPSSGALMGTAHSNEVIEQINAMSGGNVIFGQPGDPYRERYQALRQYVMDNLNIVNNTVAVAQQAILNPNKMVALESEDQLYDPPECMKLPILLYEPIRALFKDGRISGYGYNVENLPEEDMYGRLINNGRVECGADKELIRTYRTDDPSLTDDDLEVIESTRKYLDKWLIEQMADGGEMKDPTDPSNTISKHKQ